MNRDEACAAARRLAAAQGEDLATVKVRAYRDRGQCVVEVMQRAWKRLPPASRKLVVGKQGTPGRNPRVEGRGDTYAKAYTQLVRALYQRGGIA